MGRENTTLLHANNTSDKPAHLHSLISALVRVPTNSGNYGKPGKSQKKSMHGKIMEFEKNLNYHGKIMEFCEII